MAGKFHSSFSLKQIFSCVAWGQVPQRFFLHRKLNEWLAIYFKSGIPAWPKLNTKSKSLKWIKNCPENSHWTMTSLWQTLLFFGVFSAIPIAHSRADNGHNKATGATGGGGMRQCRAQERDPLTHGSSMRLREHCGDPRGGSRKLQRRISQPRINPAYLRDLCWWGYIHSLGCYIYNWIWPGIPMEWKHAMKVRLLGMHNGSTSCSFLWQWMSDGATKKTFIVHDIYGCSFPRASAPGDCIWEFHSKWKWSRTHFGLICWKISFEKSRGLISREAIQNILPSKSQFDFVEVARLEILHQS